MPIITPNNSSQINPQTGLAYSTQELEIRRRAGALASQAQSLSPLDERFNITGNNLNMSQNELETFTDRNVNLQVDGANEEIRAERQSTTEKLANGVIKFGGKTLTATAGGILGPVIGIPTAIKDGSFNSFFDNDYQRWLDSMNQSMDSNLPNYRTKEEQDAGFFKSLGTANFWADDFLGAMSFTAGAILTEYATAGLGSLGIANKIMSPLQKAARAKEVLKGLDIVSNLNAFGKAANVTRQLITGAGYEAGVEARQFKDEARKSAIAGFMQTHDGQEPNEQELAEIESHVNNTANAVFAANMGIVGLSNFLQYPKIFGAGTKAEIAVFGKAGLIGEQGAYKAAYTEAKGLTKGLYTAGKILERPVEEGLWEEGMQSTVQNAAQNYITNMYSLDGLTNQKDIFDSLGDAFAESYGTKEGWKSIGMGMMIGGIGSPSFRYNKAEGIGSLWSGGIPDALKELRDTQKNIDNLATKNNNFNVAQIAEQAKQNRAIFEASKRYDAAVERGDMFEAKSAEHDVLFAMTAARHDAGLAGNFKTDLTKHIDSLTDEQFADTYGYTNKTAEELQARKIEVKEKAIKKVDQHIKAIEKAKQLLPSEDSQDEGRKNMQLGLAYAITGIEDLDAREDELSEFIASKVNGVITNDLKSINSIKRLTKDQNEKLSEYKKELKKLNSLKETYDRAVTFSPSDKDEEQYKKRQTEASTKIEDQEKVLKEKEKELKDVKKIINEAKKANYDYAEIDSFRDSVSKIMKINELKEKAKLANPLDKQDIEAAFNDLDKIASRRHDLLDTYNKLFTKAGQKEVDTMTKQMLKQLQAFGIHIANPEANLRAMAQMELQRTGKTINEFGKVVPIEDNTEATDEAIKDALDKLSTKVDDTSKNIFKDVQDLLEEAPITLAELNTFIQKLTLLEKSLQQDKNKYSDEDTQLRYDDFLMNIMDRLTEAKAQLVTLKAGVKEAANTPFAATVNNPSDVFTLFQGFISPEVQSMVSALSNEDLKGRVRIKIEDLPEEMKTKSLLEKIPGSGVFLKNGHTKKEGKGIYVYLDDVRIGGLFDPRRFVHKNGKEMIISENNPALIKLINPDFVAPDNTLTDTGKKFVRYYKAMKNFYETTLDVKDELSPEETEKLLSFQVIAERFVKYADENKPYSERPKIATEFSDPKWNVEIPGVFKGLIVFNRLKLDDEYRTGEYIFIRSEGKTSWEKPDDNLKSQIQDFINKQAKESNLTIGWGSMSQYGLLVKTNESGKNLRVVDVGIPTLTVEDKKGFMNNLFAQVKEAAEQFNDPENTKTVINKTLLDEKGNEYFVPLLTGKEKKEGSLKTQLNFSIFKNGDVSIGLEIYYKGKNYYVNVKNVFKESITVESIEKVLTFDKLIGRLDSYLAYNLSEDSVTNKKGEPNKSSLYGTPIAKFEPSLSLNDPIRRMPDLEGNEDLFEQMVVNSNVVFGNHNIQVKPKDAETSKYDVNNPLPKTQTKPTATTTPKGITPEQQEALDKALIDGASVASMVGIHDELKLKVASLDKDTIQKLNTISNRIKEIRKKLGYTNAEEDEVKEEVKSDLADIQQEYKTLKDELDELDAKISINVHDKADEVRRVEVKAKVTELANKIKEEKAKEPDDEDSVVFSTSMTPTSDRMEYEKALNTLKRILPDFISVAEIDTLIKNIQNKGETWGAFMDKIVYLNKSKAGVGTEYHEAFHAVFRLLLTNTEIDSYYDAASKRYGTPSKAQLDSLKSESSAYKSLSYKSLRKLFYEEKMADDFKKYALNKDKESKTGFTGWLKNLFDKLLRMFNAISDKREELDILFSNIYSGSFKNAKEKYNIFSKNAKPAFSLLKTNDPLLEGSDPISTLSRFKSEKLIHTIAAKLFSNVIESKGYYTEKDLNEVIDNIKARYSPDNYTEELKRLYANAGLKAVTKARKDILEFKNALEREDNITIIKDDVQTIIKELYGVALDEDFEESKNEQDTGRNEFEERSMSSVGGMNSLSKKMKQYMNMTMYYTDEFGLGITPEELNQEKYQVAINGSELYQGLERLLANTNKTQLFEKLYQYKSSNVNADAFYNKIVQDIADDISSNFESVENMLRDLGNIENDQVQLESAYKQLSSSPAFNSFIIAFNKNKVKYFKVLYDAKKGNIKGINANDQDVDTIQFEKWKSNFISKQLTKGQVDEILSNIRSMINNYNFNTKKEDLNSAINSIKSEFGKLGIDLSFGFIKYSLVTKHADSVNKIAMTGNQYAQELVKFIDIFSDVIPLQTYESLIEGEDKDMFKVLKELNAKSDLKGKDATGEAATAGFFAKNVVDGEEAADTGAETRLKQLAENNAIFDESVGESTFQNAENKTVFDKVFPSYITQAITSLKENVLTQSDLNDALSLKEAYRVRGTILSDYQASVLLQVLQNNPLLKGLNYNSKSGFSEDSEVTDFIFNNMQVFIMDGLKQESLDEDSFGGTQEQGKTYKDLDKRAKALMMLSMFADTTQKFSNKVLEGFNPEGTRLFILGTNEAKSTTVGVNLPVQNFFANGNLTELGLAYFNSTFKQEYERIQKIVKELKVLQDKLNNNEPLVNYSHSYHGEIPFIRSIQFNEEGNITNWDSLKKVPRGLKFFQFAKMQNIALLNKQAVEGATLPEVNGELQNFAKSQLSDYLEMLSKSDVDILSKKIGNNNGVQITSKNYTREAVKNDPNTAYIFTENTHSIKYFPDRQGGGSAIIRPEKNAFAIVTKKKYDYNTRENVDYEDTEKDFEEFTKINLELIKKIKESGKSKIVFPQGFGTDKAKLPTRFAKWLQNELYQNFGLFTELNSTKTGLISKSVEGEGTDIVYKIKQLPSYYKKESSDEVDENKIGQYFFNHYFNTTAFNFMLHGDYAMNYKDSVDVVKRNGGLIAFGPDMGLGTSNYAVVEDEEIEIDEINSDDKSVNRTDAQALGHINWYIDTYLKGMGKYNKAVAPILDRIKMGLDLLEPLTKTELAILENNNATLQPRKIVQRDMFTYLKTSLHTITRAQVSYINPALRKTHSDTAIKKLIKKYSNEKNYDELDKIFKPIPGKEKLHDLYNQMERQDIGFTIFNSGSKMSNFDMGRHNGTSWELNKKFINNNTLREQVSTDGFKEKIVHGTQLMNLIWSEQDMKAVASFMDKSVRVSHLVEAYKGLLKYRVKIGSIDLKNTIFESSPDGKLTEAKWGELQQSFFESLEKSGADPYLLELFVEREDGTGAPKYNPNFAFVQAKYEAMYLAYVSKATLAQKTAGRKYTLVSDFGNNVMRQSLISPNDRIIFGHPTIGKSFLKNKGDNRFISLDDDYASEINKMVKEIANKNKVTNSQVKNGGNEIWNKEYNQEMQKLFDTAKQRAENENKTLFTSNTNLLKNNLNSFDKIINLTDEEFEKRITERGVKYDIKQWKEQINEVISKANASKVITTNKYLSDLLNGDTVIRIDQFRANPEKYNNSSNDINTLEGIENQAIAVIKSNKGDDKYIFLNSQKHLFGNTLVSDDKQGERIKGKTYKGINIVSDYFTSKNIKDKSGKDTINILFVDSIEKAQKQFDNYIKGGSKQFTSLETNKTNNVTTSRLRHRVADGKGGFYSEVIISEKAARVHNLKAGDTIPDALAEQFGIRIPTQDDHSMANLKVVDVIPGYYGNAITVPVEIIKLSGADFDIDSMYARIFSVFNNQFKGNGLHAHGDYLKADNIDSAYEIAFDEYLNAVAKESAVKEQLEELKDYDVDYYPIQDAIDEILEEMNKSKIEDRIFAQSVKDKIDEIKAVYSTDEEFNEQLIRKTYKGELNQHVFNLKIQTAKPVGKISKGVYAEDKKELLEHLGRLKELSKETNKKLQLEAIKLAGYASTKNDFLDAQSLNKDGVLKNNRDLINKNLKAFNNGDIEDISPLSKEEADNLLLSIERGLLHNSSEAKKKIGLTPSSMDNFKSLRKTFTKMGLPSADATTGINSPLDILLSANANDVGKKGIGPAALFNVIFQKLNESNVHLSEKFKEGLIGGLDRFDTFGKFNNAEGKRINDVVSSIISAMTDNAKERYAAAFNLTPDTLGPALTMVGLGIPFDTVMAFMKQPIIVEMANWYTMSQSPIKPQFTKGETDEEKADVKSKFSALVNKKGESMLNEAIVSLGLKGVEVKQEFDLVNFAPDSDLVQGLLKGNNAESRLSKEQYEQLQVLVGNMFLEYKKMSDNLMNLSAVSALTKGLKSTWVETKSLDDSLERLGFKIATNSLDGPNSYTLSELPIKDEDKIFLGLKDVLSKPDVLTNLQTYGFVRDSAKFYFILQTPQAKRIAEQIKKNFREGHFAYEENKIALDRAIISGLTMLAYKNKIATKTGKDFKFNFNLLFSETPGTWGKLPLLMQKALKTERYRNNPLLNYLKTKQITFEKNVFKGKTLNKIEGNTRSEKNYDYLEALMDGYRQIAIDSFNNTDLNDGLTSKEVQALNGWLVQYIIAKDSLLFLKGSYIKNLTPAALRNASVSLDDIQELFSETSNKSFVDVFGMPKQDVLAEIEELYSRGVETAWRGLKGSKAKIAVLRAESAIVASETNDYPFFIDENSLTLNIYASLTNSTKEEDKKKIMGKNLSMFRRNELAQETEVGGETRLAFPTFLMIKNDNKINDYWKVKSFNATIAGNSVKIDAKGYILEGPNKGKNLEQVSSSSYNSIFTPEGIVATKIEYEKTLGKLGHKSVKPWAFTVAQWDALLNENLERELLENFSGEEIEIPEEEAIDSFEELKNRRKIQIKEQEEEQEEEEEEEEEDKKERPKLNPNKLKGLLKNKKRDINNTDDENSSLFSDEQSTSKEKAEVILNKLSEKFGVKWKWSTDIKGLGQFSNNTVLINPNKFKADTLFHEFAHPFVLAISRTNPALYQSLKQEILSEGKTLERVRKEYKNEITNEEDFIMESIVTLMGKYASEVNNKKSENLTSSLKDLINKFFKEFAKLLKLITGNKDINVRELTNMSIRDLGALMVLGDNKIILPNVLTTYQAIQRILRFYNFKNGNIQSQDYNKVKKAVDIYNMGVGNTSIYISKGPSGYAILSNHINFEELEKRGIIKINCK